MESVRSLIRRIKKARKLIRDGGGYDRYKEFLNTDYLGVKGLTQSNITTILKKLENLNGGEVVEDFKIIDTIKFFEHVAIEFSNSDRIDRTLFYSTAWYLYFFQQLKRSRNRVGIGRTILDINQNGEVRLWNIEDGASQNYFGRLSVSGERTVDLDLNGETPDSKLRIKLISSHTPTPLMLGASLGYEDNAVVTGRVVLQNISTTTGSNSTYNTLRPRFLTSDNKEFHKIPLPIRKYLSHIHDNQIRQPLRSIYDINSLDIFMSKDRLDKRNLFFDYHLPKMFLSTQVESQENIKQSSTVNSCVISIERSIKEFAAENNIPLDILYRPQVKGTIDADKSYYMNDLFALRDYKYYVLFLVNDNITRALVELGRALSVCKVVMVFYKEDSDFAPRLSLFETDERFKICKMYSYHSSILSSLEMIIRTIKRAIIDYRFDPID